MRFAEGQRRTGIVVDFFVPGLAPDRWSVVGEWYCRLYAQLYDENVSVMTARQERLDERAGPRLARTVSAPDLGSARSRSACTVVGAAPDRSTGSIGNPGGEARNLAHEATGGISYVLLSGTVYPTIGRLIVDDLAERSVES